MIVPRLVGPNQAGGRAVRAHVYGVHPHPHKTNKIKPKESQQAQERGNNKNPTTSLSSAYVWQGVGIKETGFAITSNRLIISNSFFNYKFSFLDLFWTYFLSRKFRLNWVSNALFCKIYARTDINFRLMVVNFARHLVLHFSSACWAVECNVLLLFAFALVSSCF